MAIYDDMSSATICGRVMHMGEIKDDKISISIACNRYDKNAKDNRSSVLYRITCFKSCAESVAKHCKVGYRVAVKGSIVGAKMGAKQDIWLQMFADSVFIVNWTNKDNQTQSDPVPAALPITDRCSDFDELPF